MPISRGGTACSRRAVRTTTPIPPATFSRAHRRSRRNTGNVCRPAFAKATAGKHAVMADTGAALIELRGVSKDYRSLRPLRIHDLQVRHAQSVALIGLDAIAA